MLDCLTLKVSFDLLLYEFDEAEGVVDDADAAEDGGLGDVDLLADARQPVAARGRQVLHETQYRNL